MATFLIVHTVEAVDHEQADRLANNMRVAFTKVETPLVMVAEIDDVSDDIAAAMAFLPPEAEVREGDDNTVVIATGIPKE